MGRTTHSYWLHQCLRAACLPPDDVPEITDVADAVLDPELAILSALVHGRGRDAVKATRIAAAAVGVSARLDGDRSSLYFDLILNSLSEAARTALQNMLPFKYEYQSDFAKHYYGQGPIEGRVEIVTR